AIALNKLSRFVGCRFSIIQLFFFSSRRRHTRSKRDWSSDVCSSDLVLEPDYLPVYNSEESSSAPVMCFPANVDSEEYETLEWVEIGRASCRERVERWGEEGGVNKREDTRGRIIKEQRSAMCKSKTIE